MKRVSFLFFSLIVLTLVPNWLLAQANYNGGLGLVYIQSARIIEPGYFTLSSHSRGFTQGLNQAATVEVSSVSGRLNINYGLRKNIELSLTPLMYEDTNKGSGSNSPGDLFFSVKIGSFTAPGSHLSYGVSVNSRIPIGSIHNLPFEPYSSGRVEFGLTSLVTYSLDPLFPEESTNIHFNIGYWNHNDVGVDLVGGGDPNSKVASMSQQLLFGTGVRIPKNRFDFSFEVYGNLFLQAPPPAAYSRENYLYITPMVHFKATRWFSLNVGADLRVIKSADNTLYAPAPGGIKRTLVNFQPNYPGWRLNIGTKFNLLPTSIFRVSERDLLMKRAQSRRDLFEEIIKEQRDTDSAEAELERIRTERIRAEKELERLRRILEGDEENIDDASQFMQEEPEPN